MSAPPIARFREVGPQRAEEFIAKGYVQRHFFPHRIYYLPKGGPDGFKLARRMVGDCRPDQMVEVVLYAIAPVVDEFPQDLFFDDDLIWHRQHFGRTGQVATANLLRHGRDLYSMVHISDLVQRIARRREHKTRVENRFKGWVHMLLNAILNFACESRAARIHFPTAALARTHTDKKRHVQAELFDRVYDRTVCGLLNVVRHGDWWAADVLANSKRLVLPEHGEETLPTEKVVCIAHDIERGQGHREVEPDFAAVADAAAPQHLRDMLAIEATHGVSATYNVVGSFFSEVHDAIRAGGHSIGFHSFDHPTAVHGSGGSRDGNAPSPERLDQLPRCRQVDYRLRGYRPPQSRLTAEVSAANLCLHNFEWLASSARSLQMQRPMMRDGIVWIPILFDDFDLHRGTASFADWERMALERLSGSDTAVFSLHDCYASHWLPRYPQFLERIAMLGRLQTLDEVANHLIFSHAL